MYRKDPYSVYTVNSIGKAERKDNKWNDFTMNVDKKYEMSKHINKKNKCLQKFLKNCKCPIHKTNNLQ